MTLPSPPVLPTSRAPGGVLTLFRVAFRHGFYNDAGGRCTDLRAVPTARCARLMASLGMVFCPTPAGFIIGMAPSALGALAHRMSDGPSVSADRGRWMRLTLALVPSDPMLLAVGDMPFDASPSTHRLHVSDIGAEMSGEEVRLGATGAVDATALHPPTGAGLPVAVPAGTKVSLTDVSGAEVASAGAAAGEDGRAVLDLSKLDFGLYRLAQTDGDGMPVARTGGREAPSSRVYAPATTGQIGFVDLFLTRPSPEAGDAGCFPVSLAPAASVRPVEAMLTRRQRETHWAYYVAARGDALLSSDLQITGEGTAFTKSAAVLPTGQSAALFSADTPLPLQLQRRPTARFRLQGHRQTPFGGCETIDIPRLPGAPPSPVWPKAGRDKRVGVSEIYVYV